MTRMFAPILAFTCEEIWLAMPHRSADDGRSVLLNCMVQPYEDYALPEDAMDRWARIAAVRSAVNGALEQARADKTIGKSLEAEVDVTVPAEDAFLADLNADTLADLLIVSQVRVTVGDALSVTVAPAQGVKCARCWKVLTSVGTVAGHDTLCPRCAAGVVERAYNLGWDHVPVCRMLEERFHVPCRLSNDANCAALAEQVAGAAVGHDNVVLITLGTGVGGGIIIGGKIYDGMRGAGAELGHTLLVLDGEPCTCGRRGCWEAYSSATALIRQARQAAAEHPESLLAGAEEITGKTVFDAADRGDETANAVVDRFCDYLGAGVTNIVNALAPEVILIGGGISRQGERLLAPVRRYVEKNCFGGPEGAIPIIAAARLGNDAGIIGAAAL